MSRGLCYLLTLRESYVQNSMLIKNLLKVEVCRKLFTQKHYAVIIS